MTDTTDRQRQLAVRIAKDATSAERDALQAWVIRLLAIRQSGLSVHKRAQLALAATLESKVVWPFVKAVALHVKRLGWENRTPTQRLGLGASAVAMALFGGQSAGIAALGTAIAVPLWVVFGAGSMFAKYLIEELGRNSKSGAVTYSVIDAEQVAAATDKRK